MPTGNFRQAWNDAAAKQGPLKRLAMRAVSNNPKLMSQLEKEANAKVAADPKLKALPWSQIIALLLPLLLQLLQKKLTP